MLHLAPHFLYGVKQASRLRLHIPAADDQLHAIDALTTAHRVLDGYLNDVEARKALADLRVVVDAQHALGVSLHRWNAYALRGPACAIYPGLSRL